MGHIALCLSEEEFQWNWIKDLALISRPMMSHTIMQAKVHNLWAELTIEHTYMNLMTRWNASQMRNILKLERIVPVVSVSHC